MRRSTRKQGSGQDPVPTPGERQKGFACSARGRFAPGRCTARGARERSMQGQPRGRRFRTLWRLLGSRRRAPGSAWQPGSRTTRSASLKPRMASQRGGWGMGWHRDTEMRGLPLLREADPAGGAHCLRGVPGDPHLRPPTFPFSPGGGMLPVREVEREGISLPRA